MGFGAVVVAVVVCSCCMYGYCIVVQENTLYSFFYDVGGKRQVMMASAPRPGMWGRQKRASSRMGKEQACERTGS